MGQGIVKPRINCDLMLDLVQQASSAALGRAHWIRSKEEDLVELMACLLDLRAFAVEGAAKVVEDTHHSKTSKNDFQMTSMSQPGRASFSANSFSSECPQEEGTYQAAEQSRSWPAVAY